MAQDKVSGTKVSKFYDREAVPGVRLDAAPQLGIVKDNLSPARDGRLRVWIPDFGGDENNPQFWTTLNSTSPYAGSTYQPQTSKNNNFTGVSHSYGMWMVPPDIGNWVICVFINGDPERGFWIGCVPNQLSRWMIPGLAAGVVDKATVSNDIKASILPDTNVPAQVLPVTEFNENIPSNISGTFYTNPKPVHEFQANILFQQGLDRDKVRGAISSSSQRETPSHVFGISTPGRALTKDPADDPGYADKVNTGNIPADQYSVPSRKGGHTFVMDDGDANGVDQLIRLRTAGGHQILMNDDQSTMYIAHKNGTSWVEIDDNGIKIYTGGDLSVRAEGTFNLHADKDINIQSGGSINIDAETGLNATSARVNIGGTESMLIYGAKTNIGAGLLTVSSDGKLNVSSGTAMTISGSTIDINGGSGGNSISCPTIKKNKLADTTYDKKVTKLWNSVPQAIDSVVTILPSHEPWVRTGTPAPLTKEVPTSICPPKMGAPVSYTLPPPNNNKLDNGKVKGQPVPWTTDTAFLNKVQSVATVLNANYIDLLAFMYNESAGTFDPAIVNSIGATGLIQFMPTTAIGLGTTTTALAQLSRVDQMDWVLKYFNYFKFTTKAPTPSLQDLYLCVFWPAAVGKPDNYVIANPGTAVATQNRGLQAADGSITCASVGATVATKRTIVQQALANAGTALPQPGVVSSSNGSNITDGSGNPVRSGGDAIATTSTTDVGITNAVGQATVGDSCPLELLKNTSTYSPSAGIGSANPKFAQSQVKGMMAELGYFESQFNYSLISNDRTRIGKYQVDAQYLAQAGYIKSDAIKQYGTNTLSKSESWTGKDSITSQNDFFSSQTIQDTIQFKEFSDNYTALLANKGILASDDICTAAGMLFVAHQFRSVSAALKWRQDGKATDAYNRPGAIYYNHGRYSIDVLSAGGAASNPATSATSSAAGPDAGPPNTTGINPDDVFTFASFGSGTRSNFDQLNGAFKNAVLQMAQDFKAKTGSKVTLSSAYRSPSDQDAIYQRWLEAGGGPNNPTAGGITTPAKPISQGGKGSPHNLGVAIDSSQCPLINNTVTLAQYGLRWGGTFTKPDAVHIQLINNPQ